jgi:hypothetical protein
VPSLPPSFPSGLTRSRFLWALTSLSAGCSSHRHLPVLPVPVASQADYVPPSGSLVVVKGVQADSSGEYQLLSIWCADPVKSTWRRLTPAAPVPLDPTAAGPQPAFLSEALPGP